MGEDGVAVVVEAGLVRTAVRRGCRASRWRARARRERAPSRDTKPAMPHMPAIVCSKASAPPDLSKARCHETSENGGRLNLPSTAGKPAPRPVEADGHVDVASRGLSSGRAERRRRRRLMPPLEHDQLPQPQRVVALAGQVLVRRAAARTPAGSSRAAACAATAACRRTARAGCRGTRRRSARRSPASADRGSPSAAASRRPLSGRAFGGRS